MSSARVAAMHQPNYIPWAGYFHKIAQCDVFVYLDAVQYPRGQSFAARNRIMTPSGPAFLTIPVSVPHGSDGKVSYLEVEFADARWRAKHVRTIEQSYARAPHFASINALYAPAVESAESLVDLNIALIESFAAYLGITTTRVRLSEIVESFGQKSDLIVDVCRALDAGVYLSGSGGGRTYNDEELLARAGIELRYDAFQEQEHPQLWGGPFEPRLSILDMLFNCGPASRELVTGTSALPSA